MKTVLLCVSLFVPLAALAADEVAPIGASTHAWVELQKSGEAAGGPPRPLPGEVADKVYERYLESFTRPIPQNLARERFVGGGGGGGGSSR